MIKNSRAALTLALAGVLALGGVAGCDAKPEHPGAYQGVVEFDERVLGFELGGRVTEISVRRGDTVRDGDVLAAIDDSLVRTARDSREAEAKAALAQAALVRAGSRPEEILAMAAQVRAAKANEDLLEKTRTRLSALLAQGAIPQASLDEVESNLSAASAQRQALDQRLRELKSGARRQEIEGVDAKAKAAAAAVQIEDERLSRHELRAIHDGTVVDVHVDPGEIVAPGSPVLTVGDTTHPYADVFVPEGELEDIRVGSPAEAKIDAASSAFRGEVESIGRRTEFTPRYLFSPRERPNLVVRVRVRLEDRDQKLHAGVPAFVTIVRGQAPAGAVGSIDNEGSRAASLPAPR